MTDDRPVRYGVSDGVATLTMDQPHNRNALTPALLGEGVAASTRLDPQAKSLSEWLRARVVDVPRELLGS